MIGPAKSQATEVCYEDRLLADVDCMTAVSALAGDSAEMLRDRLIFCNQFVIEDPYPAIVRDTTPYRGTIVTRMGGGARLKAAPVSGLCLRLERPKSAPQPLPDYASCRRPGGRLARQIGESRHWRQGDRTFVTGPNPRALQASSS
jgi:hypothetical protein